MICIMAAMGRKRELGNKNKLPWHLPDDLKRFRDITRGHSIIMGRKTYESIGKVLPDRQNIVVTRDPDYKVPGGVVVNSMEEAIGYTTEDVIDGKEVFIIGGGEIYRLALPYADKMYLTFVDAEIPADTFFPEFNEKEWREVSAVPHAADDRHAFPFVFKTYEKKKEN
jgi:dihydrofolate reductase